MPSSTLRPQFRHFGVFVRDIEAMKKFYTSVLGLYVTDSGFAERIQANIAFLSSKPQHHHELVLVGRKADAPAPISNVHQISFEVSSLAELRTMQQRMQDARAGEVRAIDHGNAWSIYGSDPEGNGLEVYVDSPWHVSQPHGRPLDLGQSDEEILRSTEAAVRKDPTFASREERTGEMERLMRGGPA